MLVVNLYPFEAAISRPDCTDAEAIENIDVGGPAMLRAAAKNHERVTVVVDPADYPAVLAALADGEPPSDLRRALAVKAFEHTSRYDAAISRYLRSHGAGSDEWPDALVLSWQLAERYATARTRIRARRSTGRPLRAEAPSLTRANGKASSCRSTTSSTLTRRIKPSTRSTRRPA